MYELIFAKRALEEFNKFETNIKERIWNKLQLIKENPFRFQENPQIFWFQKSKAFLGVEKLVEISGFKLRVGDYRVLVDIDSVAKKIYINKIGHRRNVYGN